MGVMAVGAEKVGPLPGTRKVSRPFSMNTRSPVSVLRPMTFAAEPIALGEVDQVPRYTASAYLDSSASWQSRHHRIVSA